MTQWLTLWRAAHLIGVSRSVLQQRIRAGELQTTEGSISTEELLRVYPQVQLEESGAFERVAKIKEQAFGRRVREHVLPSQEVLAQRLFAQSEELTDLRRHLQRYHNLVIALQSGIHDVATASNIDALNNLELFAEKGLADVLATEAADVLDIMNDALKVMSAQVTIRPSGREFTVEGHDTLLQAGLRAGLRLNYGCGNGTCGLCKARVISGAVTRSQPSDYPLSEAEKLQGYTLLCSHTAASSEVVIETLEARGPQDIPQQQIVARVRALTPLAKDTLLLHLQTPRTSRLRFLAGQSVTLGTSTKGDDEHADYSIASCPCDDRNVQFYVPRNTKDLFAQRLFEGAVKVGDSVSIWGPQGNFILAETQRPLVFIACDTGFAPVKSLIEHAMAVDAAESLSLYWLATRADGHFLANQCRAWGEALDNFDFTLHTESDVAVGARHFLPAIRADLFVTQCEYYVAGPAEFSQTVSDELRAAGVPQRQIFALEMRESHL